MNSNELANRNDQQPEAQAQQQQQPTTRPRVDVFENAHEYLVVADVPGVAKDGLDVRFESGELRIEAHRSKPPTQEAQGSLLAEEYRIGDYRRAFAMPDGIDADKIEAELAHGVLRVHLPKSAAKRPRKIAVRAS
jgi:HSP20 family molecular chaperone IbpA